MELYSTTKLAYPRFDPATMNYSPNARVTDIFAHLSEIGVPEHCFIAGAGPTLNEDLQHLPDDAFVVAVNSAVTANYPFAMWVCYDSKSPGYPWFQFEPDPDMLVVFGETLWDKRADYSFEVEPRLEKRQLLVPGSLQRSGTVAMCAAQLLYWAGARIIGLLAIPMQGTQHFDGTPVGPHPQPWGETGRANMLIRRMGAKGTQVYSFCPTALKVPVRRPFARPVEDHDYLVVSAFTPNYEPQATALRESLDRFGVQHMLIPYESKGSWMANVGFKPTAILQALESQPLPVIWFDADNVMIKPTPLFRTIRADFSAHYNTKATAANVYDFRHRTVVVNTDKIKTPAGTVMYFANNPAVHGLVKCWQALVAEHGINDEQCLREALNRNHHLEIAQLPIEYSGIDQRNKNSVVYSKFCGRQAGKPPRGGI